LQANETFRFQIKTELLSDGTSCPAALLRLGVPAQRLTLVNTDFTKDDAALSAELEVNAEKRGNKIPRFDAMIAAVAINRGIKLFTFNKKHFDVFEELTQF